MERAAHNGDWLEFRARAARWKRVPYTSVPADHRKLVKDHIKNMDANEFTNSDTLEEVHAPKASPTIANTQTPISPTPPTPEALQLTQEVEQIHNSVDDMPKDMILEPLTWKLMVRAILRGTNIMMTGPAGSGKTMTAYAAANHLRRELHVFNLGATQDPRASLIGQTHFHTDQGTFFNESQFIKAIRTPNTVILLDEISRAHPEAWNILMSVLDPQQRYIRLDESEGSPVVKVADGVCFIATANIGTAYTATRTLDHALRDRFQTLIEMKFLSRDSELDLLTRKFPYATSTDLRTLTAIASAVRDSELDEDSCVETSFGTRQTEQAAALLQDGFTIQEVAQACIYPLFDGSGGEDSERTYVRQLCQAHIPTSHRTEEEDMFPF